MRAPGPQKINLLLSRKSKNWLCGSLIFLSQASSFFKKKKKKIPHTYARKDNPEKQVQALEKIRLQRGIFNDNFSVKYVFLLANESNHKCHCIFFFTWISRDENGHSLNAASLSM